MDGHSKCEAFRKTRRLGLILREKQTTPDKMEKPSTTGIPVTATHWKEEEAETQHNIDF